MATTNETTTMLPNGMQISTFECAVCSSSVFCREANACARCLEGLAEECVCVGCSSTPIASMWNDNVCYEYCHSAKLWLPILFSKQVHKVDFVHEFSGTKKKRVYLKPKVYLRSYNLLRTRCAVASVVENPFSHLHVDDDKEVECDFPDCVAEPKYSSAFTRNGKRHYSRAYSDAAGAGPKDVPTPVRVAVVQSRRPEPMKDFSEFDIPDVKQGRREDWKKKAFSKQVSAQKAEMRVFREAVREFKQERTAQVQWFPTFNHTINNGAGLNLNLKLTDFISGEMVDEVSTSLGKMFKSVSWKTIIVNFVCALQIIFSNLDRPITVVSAIVMFVSSLGLVEVETERIKNYFIWCFTTIFGSALPQSAQVQAHFSATNDAVTFTPSDFVPPEDPNFFDTALNVMNMITPDWKEFSFDLGKIIPVIGSCFALIATTCVLKTTNTKQGFTELINRFSKMSGCIRSAKDVATLGSEVFSEAVEYIRVNVFGYDSSALDAFKNIDEWVAEVVACNNTDFERRLKTEDDMKMRVDDLIQRGWKINGFLDKLPIPMSQRTSVTNAMVFLQRIRETASSCTAGQTKPRVAPAIFHIFGDSGVGKSTSLWALIASIQASLGVTDVNQMRAKTYFRRTGEKFWDGFDNEMTVCVVDDFGAKVDDISAPCTDFFEAIHMSNTAFWQLNMANLHEKGATFFNCKSVLWTSNASHFAVKSLTNAEAVLRRIAGKYRQRPAEGFGKIDKQKGKDVMILDSEKVWKHMAEHPERQALGMLDCIVFDEIDKHDPNDRVIKANITFEELADIIVKKTHETISEFEKFSEKTDQVFQTYVDKFAKHAPKTASVQMKTPGTVKINRKSEGEEFKLVTLGTERIGFSEFTHLDVVRSLENAELLSVPAVEDLEEEDYGVDYGDVWKADCVKVKTIMLESVAFALCRAQYLLCEQMMLGATDEQCKRVFDAALNHYFAPSPEDIVVCSAHDSVCESKQSMLKMLTTAFGVAIPVGAHVCEESVREVVRRNFFLCVYESCKAKANEVFCRLEVFNSVTSLMKVALGAFLLCVSGYLFYKFCRWGINKITEVGTTRRVRKNLKKFVKDNDADDVEIQLVHDGPPYDEFVKLEKENVNAFLDSFLAINHETHPYDPCSPLCDAYVALMSYNLHTNYPGRKEEFAKRRLELVEALRGNAADVEKYQQDITKAAQAAYVEKYSTDVTKAKKTGVVEKYSTDVVKAKQAVRIEKYVTDVTKARKNPTVETIKINGKTVNRDELKNVTTVAQIQMITDKNAAEIVTMLHKAMYKLECKDEEGVWQHTLNLLVFKGRLAIVNRHLLASKHIREWRIRNAAHPDGIPLDLFDCPRYFVDDSDEVFGMRDVMIVELPRVVELHRDLTSKFMTGEDFSKFQTLRQMSMIGYVPEELITLRQYFSSDIRADDSVMTLEDEGRPLYSVRKFFEYGVQTTGGDCGAALVSFDPAFNNKIFGIHTGGFAGPTYTAMGTPVSQAFLKKLEAGLVLDNPEAKMSTPQMKECVYESKVSCRILADNVMDWSLDLPFPGNYMPLGQAQRRVFAPGTSNIQRSPLHGIVAEPTMKPAHLSVFRNAEGELVDPMAKARAKAFPAPMIMNRRVLKQATNDFSQSVCARALKSDKRVLSHEEGICGVEGDELYAPLNRSSSPGYGWDKKQKGKTFWLGSDSYITDNAEVLSKCNEILSLCKQEIRPCVIWVDTLKDERRLIEKVDAGKTRLFSVGEMCFTILFRRYFLGFIAHMMRNKIDLEACVGVNVYSVDWNRLGNAVQSVGKKVLAGDFGNYDGTLNADLLWKVLDVIEDFYQGTDEDRSVRRALWCEIVNSIHISGDNLYMWTHSQPSGCPMTTILNCVYHSISARYVFLMCARKHCPELATLSVFADHVRHFNYGDDDLWNVSDFIAPWFNMASITEAYADFGMEYTDESKKVGETTFRTLDDVNFLKRKFRFDEEQCRYRAPLALETIREMPMWVHGKTDTWYLTADTLMEAVHELAQHSEEVFNQEFPRFEEARKIVGAHVPCRFDTYDGYQYVESAKYCV